MQHVNQIKHKLGISGVLTSVLSGGAVGVDTLLPLPGLLMPLDGLERKAQGRHEQTGPDEQASQTVGEEQEAIGFRPGGCARSEPPRRWSAHKPHRAP